MTCVGARVARERAIMKKLAAVTFILCAAMSGTAFARPHRPGYGYGPGYGHGGPPPVPRSTWYLGAGLVGTEIVGQSGGPEQLEGGGGLSAWIGLHVSDVLSLELGWLGSFHNPAGVATWYGDETDFLVLEGVTADAKIHLTRGGQRFAPYLQGGVGLYFLGSEHLGMDSVGTGFQAGGGFDLWLSPAVTLGVRGRYHGISMGPPEGGERDTFISAVTIEGSVGFHF